MDIKLYDIPGYEGLYAINKQGDVWSYPKAKGYGFTKGAFLKKMNSKGYDHVTLVKDGKDKMCRIHRLIAEIFIPNPENKTYINHKNGIKNDNSVENLEWCTAQENSIHAHKTGLWYSTDKHKESASIQGILSRKKVMQLTKEGILCKIYSSTHEAARITGLTQATISNTANNKYKNPKGYLWRFVTS